MMLKASPFLVPLHAWSPLLVAGCHSFSTRSRLFFTALLQTYVNNAGVSTLPKIPMLQSPAPSNISGIALGQLLFSSPLPSKLPQPQRYMSRHPPENFCHPVHQWQSGNPPPPQCPAAKLSINLKSSGPKGLVVTVTNLSSPTGIS